MENLVGADTFIAIRGASGKLGSLVKQSLELSSISSVSINRGTNFLLNKGPLIVLDFAGPNPKNEQYWESFSLSKVLDEHLEFLEWVKKTHSIYIRIGSYGEFNSNLTRYENVAREISGAAKKFLSDPEVNGLILYPSNIYGRRSLGNFVEIAIESCFRKEILALVNQDKLVNFIHFQDLMQFLLDLVQRIQSNEDTYSSLALISDSHYSVEVINEYIANQFRDFDVSRVLQQEIMRESKLNEMYSNSVSLKILPNRLKNYIDSTVMNGLESDIPV